MVAGLLQRQASHRRSRVVGSIKRIAIVPQIIPTSANRFHESYDLGILVAITAALTLIPSPHAQEGGRTSPPGTESTAPVTPPPDLDYEEESGDAAVDLTASGPIITLNWSF
jgi:hypothetical protein